MSWRDWTKTDAEFAHDYLARVEEQTPEPLFETTLLTRPMVCLRCGENPASSLLVSPQGMKPVLPLCVNCASDWNVQGYRILKGMKPQKLLLRLALYKLKRPFSKPSLLEIKSDVNNFQRWAAKMKKLRVSEA